MPGTGTLTVIDPGKHNNIKRFDKEPFPVKIGQSLWGVDSPSFGENNDDRLSTFVIEENNDTSVPDDNASTSSVGEGNDRMATTTNISLSDVIDTNLKQRPSDGGAFDQHMIAFRRKVDLFAMKKQKQSSLDQVPFDEHAKPEDIQDEISAEIDQEHDMAQNVLNSLFGDGLDPMNLQGTNVEKPVRPMWKCIRRFDPGFSSIQTSVLQEEPEIDSNNVTTRKNYEVRQDLKDLFFGSSAAVAESQSLPIEKPLFDFLSESTEISPQPGDENLFVGFSGSFGSLDAAIAEEQSLIAQTLAEAELQRKTEAEITNDKISDAEADDTSGVVDVGMMETMESGSGQPEAEELFSLDWYQDQNIPMFFLHALTSTQRPRWGTCTCNGTDFRIFDSCS
jgi:hypothetical protein